MNRPTKNPTRHTTAHLAGALLLAFAAMAALPACKSSLECRPVEVNSGCEARCSRVIKKDGKELMCTDQLLANQVGENAILQRKTKKITTKKLDAEVCFPVVERKIADEAIRKELGNKCQAP
jgi:hypothetical protein